MLARARACVCVCDKNVHTEIQHEQIGWGVVWIIGARQLGLATAIRVGISNMLAMGNMVIKNKKKNIDQYTHTHTHTWPCHLRNMNDIFHKGRLPKRCLRVRSFGHRHKSSQHRGRRATWISIIINEQITGSSVGHRRRRRLGRAEQRCSLPRRVRARTPDWTNACAPWWRCRVHTHLSGIFNLMAQHCTHTHTRAHARGNNNNGLESARSPSGEVFICRLMPKLRD